MIELSPQEKLRWREFQSMAAAKSAGSKQRKFVIPHERRQAAINLYLKTGSKNYVCKKLHMGWDTLQAILVSAGVV